MAKKNTRAERNIRWIEDYCRIPEGKFVGQKVKLRPWQKKELIKIYDNPAGTRTAILSFGKKNAKTTLSGFILLLHLCGPESIPNTQLYSTGQSRDQAAVIYDLTSKMVLMEKRLDRVLILRDSKKQIYCPGRGVLFWALSADANTAHGKSPILAIHDELGQVKGPVSEMYNAIDGAMSAHENPLSIIISTQAPTDGDLLSTLIDDALEGKDPTVTVSLYTADPDINPFSVKALKQANPAYGDFQSAKELKALAAKAKRMPAQENLYRNFNLNQRVEAHSPFISRSIWDSCIGDVLESFVGYPVYGGLDLSEVSDLTALTLVALVDGNLQTKSTFWLPGEGLADKARADRVPYDLWHKQGYLSTVPGRSIEYPFIAKFVKDLFDILDLRSISFDRWNFKHFRRSLIEAGFTEDQIEELFKEFGQGFQSMSPALRDTESALLNGKLIHDNNPVMNMCAANAVVQTDPAGNRKLTKAKSSGRIDGMISLVMAIATASQAEDLQPSVYESRGLLVI